MFRDNGVHPVELFRDISLEPGDRITHVDHAVGIGAAATHFRKRTQGEIVGNQAFEL